MKVLCPISGAIRSRINRIVSVLLIVLCFGLSNSAANSSSEVVPPANCDTYGMEILSRKVIEKSGEMQCVVTLEIRGDCNGGWSASDFDLKLKDVHMAEPEQYPDMKRGMVQRPASQSYTFDVLLLGEKRGALHGNQSFKIKKKKIATLKDFKKPYRIKFQSGRLDVGYYSAD
ncbi:MAG: hypothetical protein OEW15_18855 [Nitrospirota bacterium]|nr:hypothetical protein [Nitrospirota bacterium]